MFIKGTVHSRLKIMLSFAYPQVIQTCMTLFSQWTQNTCKWQWMRTGDVKQQDYKKDTIKVVHTTHYFPSLLKSYNSFVCETDWNLRHYLMKVMVSALALLVIFMSNLWMIFWWNVDLKLVYIILFTNLTNLITAIHNFRKLPVNLRRKQIKLNIVRLQETWAIYNLKIHLYNI